MFCAENTSNYFIHITEYVMKTVTRDFEDFTNKK